jgi:hypothetical protein
LNKTVKEKAIHSHRKVIHKMNHYVSIMFLNTSIVKKVEEYFIKEDKCMANLTKRCSKLLVIRKCKFKATKTKIEQKS